MRVSLRSRKIDYLSARAADWRTHAKDCADPAYVALIQHIIDGLEAQIAQLKQARPDGGMLID